MWTRLSETYLAWSVPGGDSARTDRGWEGKGLAGLSNIEAVVEERAANKESKDIRKGKGSDRQGKRG